MKAYIYYCLYQCLWGILLPLIMLRMWLRGGRLPAYRQAWRQRMGFVELKPCDVWLHCVSVGESIAAFDLIDAQLNSGRRVLVTNTTPTGAAIVLQQFTAAVDAGQLQQSYLPWDSHFFIRRFVSKVSAPCLVILETELWPSLLFNAAKQNKKILLANARLSAKSLAGYQRFKTLSHFMLARIDSIAVQDDVSAKHFSALGVTAEKLAVTGSVKLDFEIAPEQLRCGQAMRERWQQSWGEKPVLIAASTHADEEQLVLEQLNTLAQPLNLILVPRHPERCQAIKALCEEQGLGVCLHSESKAPRANEVLLVDAIGVMQMYFAAADVCFMGGSFAAIGGHNFIEPAAFSLPIVSGPEVFNFAVVAEQMQAAKVLEIAPEPADLGAYLQRYINNSAAFEEQGLRAREWLLAQRGAKDKQLALIERLLVATG